MTSAIEYIKEIIAKDEVKGIRFIKTPWVREFKKKSHDIEFLDDAIIYYDKKGKGHTIIPLHSCTMEILK
ncbi:MAG: hypothetical protein ACTSRW_06660 [Candidatus Helarchaeota archaeon]